MSLSYSTTSGGISSSTCFTCPPKTPPHSTIRTVIRASKVEPSEKSVEIMRKFSEQYARKSGTYFCVDKGVTSVVIKGLADHKDSLGAPLCPCRHYDDKSAEAGQGFWNCPCVPMRERAEVILLFLIERNYAPALVGGYYGRYHGGLVAFGFDPVPCTLLASFLVAENKEGLAEIPNPRATQNTKQWIGVDDKGYTDVLSCLVDVASEQGGIMTASFPDLIRKECHCMLFLTPDNDFAGKDQTVSLEEIREATANM
ncbi:unnamed protein product [Dovyalis caffra]|uniref:Ferredoxin-thioredoxin reductase catalytic chain, chloroplastic n=1 Tax=Dovyalis caffra TaxID=77055 RepID=A0AAV1R245_9ROSI|nr:unnamed protein product [Dovyalis caffra]